MLDLPDLGKPMTTMLRTGREEWNELNLIGLPKRKHILDIEAQAAIIKEFNQRRWDQWNHKQFKQILSKLRAFWNCTELIGGGLWEGTPDEDQENSKVGTYSSTKWSLLDNLMH